MIALYVIAGLAQGAEGPAWQRVGWGFGGLPAVNFNTDEGLGLGVLASFYRYDGITSPYRLATTLLLFGTTRGVHAHRIDVDALKLAGGRLRLTGRVQLEITRTNPFCGLGRDVRCDPAEAEGEAERLGLEGEDRTTFLRRYYLYAYLRPNLFLGARYRVGELDRGAKREVFGTFRAMYFQPGTWRETIPDPGNRYHQYLQEGEGLAKERGFLSVVQLGAMVDTRDFEAAPSAGVWLEGSVRAASPLTGSQFDYVGFNLTGRTYTRLRDGLVWAARAAADGIVGDAPIRELAEMGGTQIYNFGGGLNAGRGIRQRRFVGRAKSLLQNELRWTFATLPRLHLALTLVGFSDVLLVAERWSDLEDFARPVAGQGGGLRFAFDDNFIVRADVGVSEVESWRPSVYIDINNLF